MFAEFADDDKHPKKGELSMLELLITMVERIGIIVTIAFILTRFKFFRDMVYQDQLNHQQQLKAIVFFGFFGIIGTYTGLSLNTESLEFRSLDSRPCNG